ncbi:hypothetical protein [Modestobacter sp. VKM Ac-2984]|uniref:hypothetical protein n=1 Tax=Modestobacter sp. VKM Ac-2984 TaxID=3004138 RepID=UPI0022AB10CF|nr:hypothetical protein [Modestobacter sp. VKM Ac-2984]MCZ2818305.1 hypothetical protein [Modestobacter sp. VKM Ac-2984]
MAKHMLAAARRQAASGLRARSEGEHDDAALHLGTMIELLAKSYLVPLNPALIAEEKSDIANIVRVTGHSHRLIKLEPMRTVGVEAALVRIGLLHQTNGQLRQLVDLLRPVGQARNGAAHVGRVGVDPDVVAQAALRGAKLLLPLVGDNLEVFFGDYADAAAVLLDERATVLHRALELRAGRGSENFEKRFGRVPLDADQGLAYGLINVPALVDDRHRLWNCPACLQQGLLSGDVQVDVDHEVASEDGVQYSYVVGAQVIFFARRFSCPYCDMSLVGPEELDWGLMPLTETIREATELDFESYADAIVESMDFG